MKRGMFIVFEGIDWCGKTTQFKLFLDFLNKLEIDFLNPAPREPGGCNVSEQIRSILLDERNRALVSQTELLLYEAARAQLCSEIIQPALMNGKLVLLDRFYDSTTAYQGYGRQMNIDQINWLNNFAVYGKIIPDLTFYFDLSVEIAMKRKGENSDRIEKESIEFFGRVRQGYLKIAEQNPARVVKIICNSDDYERPIKHIQSEVREIFLEKFNDFNKEGK